MRILIADDDRMSTMMLDRTLEEWGFEVIVVHDGAALFVVHRVEEADDRALDLEGVRNGDVALEEATRELKTVPPEWYEVARAFFG